MYNRERLCHWRGHRPLITYNQLQLINKLTVIHIYIYITTNAFAIGDGTPL